jgi:hypothetical protein
VPLNLGSVLAALYHLLVYISSDKCWHLCLFGLCPDLICWYLLLNDLCPYYLYLCCLLTLYSVSCDDCWLGWFPVMEFIAALMLLCPCVICSGNFWFLLLIVWCLVCLCLGYWFSCTSNWYSPGNCSDLVVGFWVCFYPLCLFLCCLWPCWGLSLGLLFNPWTCAGLSSVTFENCLVTLAFFW